MANSNAKYPANGTFVVFTGVSIFSGSPILLLDDIFKSRLTEAVQDALFSVVEDRMAYVLPMILTLNNDGGGIFSFLPQAADPEHFEALFGTPTGLDFAHFAALYGAQYTRVSGWDEFRAAVQAGVGGHGLHIVEVPTERASNVALHREFWPRVNAALRAAGLIE